MQLKPTLFQVVSVSLFSLWFLGLLFNVCGPQGGELPIMAYTGRLRPKEVPFSGFR